MERSEYVQKIHRRLSRARTAVTRQSLQEELEVSWSTLKRLLKYMREDLGVSIQNTREPPGYRYIRDADGNLPELPPLGFTAEEIFALLACEEVMTRLQPGLLDGELELLRKKLKQLLGKRQGGADQLAKRMRILGVARRAPPPVIFGPVGLALGLRRQLRLHYDGRTRGEMTERVVSPQRLVRYRDNWYLDTWDHGKAEIRVFAVDRIRQTSLLADAAHELDDALLDAHLGGGYGIFSGPAPYRAVLRFSAHRARWVADEEWHPAQLSRWLDDGRYELEFPYSDTRELLMDILKHGPDCEVLAPPALRAEARQLLTAANAQYAAD